MLSCVCCITPLQDDDEDDGIPMLLLLPLLCLGCVDKEVVRDVDVEAETLDLIPAPLPPLRLSVSLLTP